MYWGISGGEGGREGGREGEEERGREGREEEREEEGGKGEREEDIFKSSTRGMSQKPHTKPKPQMITSSSFLAR